MSYNHKISDLKYRINGLVPKITCKKIIDIFEKYPELSAPEQSYKYKTKKIKEDNFSCLNLSRVGNPNEDILYALNEAKKYISIMITNYVLYIKSKKISPTFSNVLIGSSDNIRILKYEVGQSIEDHCDVSANIRASCTLNLNEDYEGGEFRFFDGQIKDSYKTGDAMIFPAEPIWIHGTEPITKGTRYSINCFLFDVNLDKIIKHETSI
jgi:predicted 2-oxoglutarate/Fe(II)-dependent dioxygenase YbiX